MEIRRLLPGVLAALALAGCGSDDAPSPDAELVLHERATESAPVTVEGFKTVTRLEGGATEPEWSNTIVRPRTRRDLGRVRLPPGHYRVRVEARDPLGPDRPLFECERGISVDAGSGPLAVTTAINRRDCEIDVSEETSRTTSDG